jgi:copper ion binding protein
MITKTLLVTDMHCSNCAMKIESIEDDLPGVKQVSASYHKGQVRVEFDENRVTTDQIIAAIKDQGYTAVDRLI